MKKSEITLHKHYRYSRTQRPVRFNDLETVDSKGWRAVEMQNIDGEWESTSIHLRDIFQEWTPGDEVDWQHRAKQLRAERNVRTKVRSDLLAAWPNLPDPESVSISIRSKRPPYIRRTEVESYDLDDYVPDPQVASVKLTGDQLGHILAYFSKSLV